MIKVLISALALSLSFYAHAQEQTSAAEGETKMKIEDAADKKNKVDGDLDQEITNRKLRAETGSKSKWSVSLTGNYQGASLEKPFDKDRPNLTNDAYTPRVRMGGDIGVRYRMTKNNSISAGTGWSIERPFHEAKRGDVSTPYITFNSANKIAGVQNVSDVGISAATDSDDRDLGIIGAFSFGNTMIYDFGGSRSSLGLAVDGYVQAFDEKISPRAQRDYGFGVYPFYEYSFNDKVNFRTVFRPWNVVHTRAKQPGEYIHIPWTQSIGVGVAVTRDVYLYPNFQYDWETWRADDFNFARKNTRASATVGLNATINVF
jgi:hypothetical protein